MVIREVVFCLLVRLRSMLYESEVGLFFGDLSFTSVFFFCLSVRSLSGAHAILLLLSLSARFLVLLNFFSSFLSFTSISKNVISSCPVKTRGGHPSFIFFSLFYIQRGLEGCISNIFLFCGVFFTYF